MIAMVVATAVVLAMQGGRSREATPGEPRIIGLVELPRVWDADAPSPATAARLSDQPMPIHVAPLLSSAVSDWVSSPSDIESREHGYEAVSAAVYATQGGWFRIRVHGRLGWIPPGEAGRYRRIEELLRDGLTHLTSAWDRRVASEPGATPVLVPRHSNDSVHVSEMRRVSADLWLKVDFLSPGHCQSAPPRVASTGWIPAYNKAGSLTVWFFSRGC